MNLKVPITAGLCILWVLLVASCQNEIVSPQKGDSRSDLVIQVGQLGSTKAMISGEYLPNAAQLGLTVVATADGSSYDNCDHTNVLATASGSGGSQVWTIDPSHPIRLSQTSGTAYAYYPYNDAYTDMTDIPISATDDQDYMYAEPCAGLSNATPVATLHMHHALAQIEVSIVLGTYTGTGAISLVSVQGTTVGKTGSMNIIQGTVTTSDANTALTDNTVYTLGSNSTSTFVAIPAGSTSPLRFEVTLDGVKYAATSADIEVEAGYIYQYTLIMNSHELQMGQVEVVSWGAEQDKDHLDMGAYQPEITWEEAKATDDVYAINERGLPVPYTEAKTDDFTAAYGVAFVLNGTAYQLALQDIDATAWGNESTNISTLTDITKVGAGLTINFGYIKNTGGSYGTSNTAYQVTKNWTEWPSNAGTALADMDGQGNTEKMITAQGSSSAYLGKAITDFRNNETVNGGYSDWFCPAAGELAYIYRQLTKINKLLAKVQLNQSAIMMDTTSSFWSSTEYGTGYAWYMYFTKGLLDAGTDLAYNKNFSHQTRLIRKI